MAIKHFHSLEELALQNCWVTVGVFDGVHRGHQEIIKRLTTGARESSATSVVITFDPHPAKVFGRGEIKLLTLPDERAEILGNMGVDVVITHPFNRDVANITAFDFMQRLKSRLGLVRLILGYDSALGKDREGNAARLTEIGAELGYAVETVPALSGEGGVISSTEIRKLVAAGNMEEAAQLMGRPYRLGGLVVRGDQRGRTIGYPTANLDYSEDKLIPPNGIYACWASLGQEKFKAAVNIGVNPTFTPDKKSVNVEAYLLDFDREIYGESLELEFISRLRDELKFDSVGGLIEQIGRDVAETARKLDES
ncbi:MAG: bifunctional riboflavin kinase/FAD synthetase [Anaerolineales bacterium]|nr:bifunctional riboflavin kinase/FAD synthetase [Anaerolineales bacterium]